MRSRRAHVFPSQFMRQFVKNILIISIPTLIVLFVLLEIFFRVAVPANDWPYACFDQSERIFKFCPPGDEGTATFGWLASQRGRWRVNNHGWVSPIDYDTSKSKPRIAVFGDSYIEAQQVDCDKSFPSVLRSEIGDRYDVYSFGVSGASLSEYVNMNRYVNRTFAPDVLIFNLRHNDFLESIYELNRGDTIMMMLDITDDSITETRPRPDYSFTEFNWKKRLLRKSAVVRYLIYNLRIKLVIQNLYSRDTYSGNVSVTNVERHRELIVTATEYLFDRIKAENPGRRIIVVMPAPRHAIYDGTVTESKVLFLNDLVAELSIEYGFEHLDLTESMTRDYEANGIEFNSPWDAHWDEYGHDFVARQVLSLGWP
ncbi:MAG: SGNH/GDSL hydrolase family protein [Candidatus Latescibacterota bacterium]|nr:MAG: SGNH/GDSL hydrolase family protein [Candidatus Latescibacterota bacterium]